MVIGKATNYVPQQLLLASLLSNRKCSNDERRALLKKLQIEKSKAVLQELGGPQSTVPDNKAECSEWSFNSAGC